MMQFVDLHTHTKHSDGVCTLVRVLAAAEEAGVELLSISDHNAVSAYDELADCRSVFSGKILPASELSTGYQSEAIEILAYGIDLAEMGAYIDANYMTLDQKRVAETGMTLRSLTEKGIMLGEDFVRRMTEDPYGVEGFSLYGCRPLCLQEMRKYPENERFFTDKEAFYTMTRHRWYRDFLANPKSELYVDQTAFFPEMGELIDVIHRAGGLAFLAHPFVYSPTIAASLDEMFARYKLDGIECYYGTFTKEQMKFLSDYCDHNGLYKSGGSDFHGLSFRPDNRMGRAAGEKIPLSLISPWFEKIKDKLI